MLHHNGDSEILVLFLIIMERHLWVEIKYTFHDISLSLILFYFETFLKYKYKNGKKAFSASMKTIILIDFLTLRHGKNVYMNLSRTGAIILFVNISDY